ncbi:MAG TPA: class III extradiol ring-cleavage dioxygenase [Alphaproteobacteria bacterium]|nr:class III extradiol ring-cleavage dioxygenase [Alphaproteobacteria bacterium]
MSEFPSVFVSHGAPTLALEACPAHAFLESLGSTLGRPEAILCVSAHWEMPGPAVSGAEGASIIHDFHGFPAPLYRLDYPAPGAPGLAARAKALLDGAGLASTIDPARGLDHGAWVPLRLMYPEADIPTTQLAVQMPPRAVKNGAGHHLAMGRALEPLRREGVLILASGGATHNLSEFAPPIDRQPPSHVAAFDAWLARVAEAGDEASLIDWQHSAPEARRAHPRAEHFMPFFVAFGAAGPGAKGRRIHQSFSYGALSMAAFVFEGGKTAP